MEMLLVGLALGLGTAAITVVLVLKHGQPTPPNPDTRATIEWTFGPVQTKSHPPKG